MKYSLALSATLFTTLLPAQEWRLSGSIEHTLWAADGVPPAFLEFEGGTLHAPRASLSIDFEPSPYLYVHSTARYDRGFDAGTHPDGDLRLDNLVLRFRPFGDNTLNIQLGKFPTIVGNWTPHHRFHDDPFLLPPLPYASIVGVNTKDLNAHSPQAIEARTTAPNPNIHRAKTRWSSVIWGPAYSNGLAVFGNRNRFNYAFEIKNTFSGSSPDEWDIGEGDFRDPQLATRIGYRPSHAWDLGFSASRGPYLDAGASGEFDRGNFNQTLFAADARWAHRDWIISGEAFFAIYDALGEDLRTFSYYLQSRYKMAPGLWVACRVGQTLSNEVSIPSGGEAPWSPDLFRAELSLGWRITPDVLFKTQYTYTNVTNGLSAPAQNLFGASLGWRF